MSDDTDDTDDATEPAAHPAADLKSLDRLVGTWKVSGEADGTVVYEWAEGGFFLLQHVDLGGNRGLDDSGHVLTGGWNYPGGGGYRTISTRT